MDYLAKHFPEMAKSFPDTTEKRKSAMAAFRVKLIVSHRVILAQMQAGAIKATEGDIQQQRDIIADIFAAQQRHGEA